MSLREISLPETRESWKLDMLGLSLSRICITFRVPSGRYIPFQKLVLEHSDKDKSKKKDLTL